MQRSDNRVLTTHVGSLVRTPRIVELQIQKYLGERVVAKDYEQAVEEGVAEVVHHQARIGLDVIDDGEYGKLNWIAYLGQRLKGLVTTELKVDDDSAADFWPEQERFDGFYKTYNRIESNQWLPETPSLSRYKGNQMTDYQNLVCRGRLEYDPAPLNRDIASLKAALKGEKVVEAFMPVVAPGSIEVVPNEHYASQEDYLFALADALNKEYRLIVDAGFVLQVDAHRGGESRTQGHSGGSGPLPHLFWQPERSAYHRSGSARHRGPAAQGEGAGVFDRSLQSTART
jgi:5-methyltetrahydropteroyltriglutamate--homocysteine methyltransferase